MNYDIEARVIKEAEYIIEHNATVRDTAKVFSVSRSIIHFDVTNRLKKLNKELYNKARKVLDKNKAERALRGGMATAKKKRELKERNNRNE